jgi:hypothetical protein
VWAAEPRGASPGLSPNRIAGLIEGSRIRIQISHFGVML